MKLPIFSFFPKFIAIKKKNLNIDFLYFFIKIKKNFCYKKNKRLIKGSNIKPWPQKGTGKARAGNKKSPIWRGGGVTFSSYILSKKKKPNIYKNLIIILLISNNIYVYNNNYFILYFFFNKKNLFFNNYLYFEKIKKIKINDFFNFDKFFFDEKSFILLINNFFL